MSSSLTKPVPGVTPRGTYAAAWPAAFAVALGVLVLLARDAGVTSFAAAIDVARVLGAAVVVFGLCGYAAARLLAPCSVGEHWPWLVLPAGAATSGLALTAAGLLGCPYFISLPAVVAAGGVTAVIAFRRPARAATARASSFVPVAGATVFVIAVVLIPTMRFGVPFVPGTGWDAHLVAGSATLVQHASPTAVEPDLPVDRVPGVWRSRYPIFYALAAVSTVAGVEPHEALGSLMALVLAVAGTGFFLLARATFGAAAAVAAAAMLVAVLDRWVLYAALHPYYNQVWGLFALPFVLLLSHAWVHDRSRRTLLLLATVGLMGALAYPLLLPVPIISLAGWWGIDLYERRRRRATPDSRVGRLWPGTRALLWLAPALLLLFLPVVALVEKLAQAGRMLTGSSISGGWLGDMYNLPAAPPFFGIPDVPLAQYGVVAVVALAAYGLWSVPHRAGLPVAFSGVLALGFAAYLRHRFGTDSAYLYYKTLAFVGPLALTAAVVALGTLIRRGGLLPGGAALVAAAALVTSVLLETRHELGSTANQLTPQVAETREWAAKLPPGESVRLDVHTPEQLWHAYMLANRPVGSRRPVNSYEVVSFSRGGDYGLTRAGSRPRDAAGPALFRNARLALWRLRSSAEDTASREKQVRP